MRRRTPPRPPGQTATMTRYFLYELHLPRPFYPADMTSRERALTGFSFNLSPVPFVLRPGE